MSIRTEGKFIISEETDPFHPYMQNEDYLHKLFASVYSARIDCINTHSLPVPSRVRDGAYVFETHIVLQILLIF
jgi:hypothetical protein